MRRIVCCLVFAVLSGVACKSTQGKRSADPVTESLAPETKDEAANLQPSSEAVANWLLALKKEPWKYSRGHNIADAVLDNRTLYLWDRDSGLISREYSESGVGEEQRENNGGGDAWILPLSSDLLVLKKNADLLRYDRTQIEAGPKSIATLKEWTTITHATLIDGQLFVGGMTSGGPAVVAYSTHQAEPSAIFRMKPMTLPRKIYFDGTQMHLVGDEVLEHYRMITPTQAEFVRQYPAAYSRVIKAKGFFYGLRSGALHVLNPQDFTALPAPLNSTAGSYPGGTQLTWDNNQTLYERKTDGAVRSYRILTDGSLQPYEQIPTIVHDGWLLANESLVVSVNSYGFTMTAKPGNLSSVTTHEPGILWNDINPLWIDENTLLLSDAAGLVYELSYRYADVRSRIVPGLVGTVRAAAVQDFYLYLADDVGIKAYDRRQTPWTRLPELDFVTGTPARKMIIAGDIAFLQLADGLYRKKLGDASKPDKLLPSLNTQPQLCASATHVYVNDTNRHYIVDLSRAYPNNLVSDSKIPRLGSCLIQGERLLNVTFDSFEIIDIKNPLEPRSLLKVQRSGIPALKNLTSTGMFWMDGEITGLEFLANFSRDPALKALLAELPKSMGRVMLVVRDRVLRVKEWKPLEW